jgi:hypothetical protein
MSETCGTSNPSKYFRRASAGSIFSTWAKDVGFHPAGADLGHPDPAAEGIDAQLARDRVHRRLCRVIGDVTAEFVVPSHRGDVDDMPAVARHHARQQQPRQMQARPQVHVDLFVDGEGIRGQDAAGPADAGVVHQNVDFQPRDQSVSAAVSDTSTAWGTTEHASASSRSLSALRARACTVSPLARSRSAMARPIPPDAPVTSAVR